MLFALIELMFACAALAASVVLEMLKVGLILGWDALVILPLQVVLWLLCLACKWDRPRLTHKGLWIYPTWK